MSLVLTVAAYACAVLVVGLAAVEGTRRLGAAVLGELRTPPAPSQRNEGKAAPPGIAASAPAAALRREAIMTPLQDRWSGQSRPGWRVIAGPQFGGSSRGPSWNRPWGFGGDDGEDERPAITGTYRTVCVRLCDGYFFPINFAVTQDRLQRDSGVCASRCGAQGRLFVHKNPGGSVEDMEDLSGRPYRQLRTAFLYRSEYVANCKCQPAPWEAAAQDRHRAYALAQEARKGNKTAAKELQTLQDKLRQTANAPNVPGQPAPLAAAGSATPPPLGDTELARREDGNLMRLGSGESPKAQQRPLRTVPRSDPDWIKRAFQSGSGG